MAPFEGQIDAVALAKIVQALSLFVSNDAALRGIQAINAPRCRYLIRQTVTTVPLGIPEAQANEKFAYMLYQVETVSGAGRYTPGNGANPDAAGVNGLEIPAGGTIITIEGAENIKNFRIIGATGATLTSNYALFT